MKSHKLLKADGLPCKSYEYSKGAGIPAGLLPISAICVVRTRTPEAADDQRFTYGNTHSTHLWVLELLYHRVDVIPAIKGPQALVESHANAPCLLCRVVEGKQ